MKLERVTLVAEVEHMLHGVERKWNAGVHALPAEIAAAARAAGKVAVEEANAVRLAASEVVENDVVGPAKSAAGAIKRGVKAAAKKIRGKR